MEGGDLRMSSIDERVVQMVFDNRQFEQGISTTLSSLDKLTKGLKLEGATKGLTDISSAAKGVSLSGIASGVENIASKFRAMSVVGITALATISQRAVSAGAQLLNSFSFGPIMAGFHEYETNLNAIQTVLANTGLEGQKGLNKVNAALNDLNTYSDKTIYNFSEMAKNVGTFTAAGVNLDTSVSAIKGIANLAAISGSNADQASTAMYQLSQALAAGKVTLQDWNSVVNAGMGGKVFQQSLVETARAHGVAVDKIIKDEGSFRNSLQKGWLTSSILTETLNKFTGDLTAKQLKAMGYNTQQIAGILKMGKTAQDAATKIKTFSQLINTLQEAVGSGWTKTWQILFGDFNEAKTLFTNVNNVLGGFVSASSNARNKVLGDWKALGGRTALIDGISKAFYALISVIKPIKDAFREIFPATTGKQLYDLTVNFRNFMERLKLGPQTAENLRRTFAGFFAILGIGWDIVKGVAKTLASLFKTATQGSGSFLGVTAKIGDFLVALHKAIDQGTGLTTFFQRLGNILAIPIKLFQVLASKIGSLFDNFNGDSAAKSVTGVADKLNPLGRLIDSITSGGDHFVQILNNILGNIGPLADKVTSFFSKLGTSISSAFSGIDFSRVLDSVNTGLFATLLLLLKNFLSKFRNQDSGISGVFSGIRESFDQLTNTLKTMQQVLKATILLEIATAIGILTISVVALSKINSDDLTRALTAMAVMFTQLFASMAVFNKFVGGAGFGKMILVTGAMILLATAVDLLTIAVKNLAGLDWVQLSKGLTGVTVLIAALAGAMKLMPATSGMISTGLGLIALAAAINILVSAVTDLAGFSWQELAKGLVGVGALLVSLALFTKFSEAGKAGVLQGAGIILLATAMKILASAMKDFSSFSWTEIGKGLSVMAGGLLLIGAALYLIPPTAALSAAGVLIVASSLGLIADAVKNMATMSWGDIGKGLTVLAGALVLIAAALYILPPSSLLSAAAILIVAASLGLISTALQNMAGMSWGEIAKGLVTLAGALGIIAVAVISMTSALPGAAALLVVAGSLLILAPVLLAFGQMSWEEIGKGLTMLAGVFVIIGAAGILLAPVVPVLIGLGGAILLLGLGMLSAGAGLLLFSAGLTALSISGAAGAGAIVAIVSSLLGLIPKVMTELGQGVIAFAKVISTAGPAMTKAITTVLNSLITAIGTLTPKIVSTLLRLLTMLVQQLANYVPKMVDAGLRLVTGILTGIGNNIGKIVAAATNIVTKFLGALGDSIPKIAQAGADFIVKFINGVAKAIDDNSAAVGEAGANLGTAIIEGMAKGLTAGIGTIADKAASIAKSAISAAKSVLDINSPSKEFVKIGESVNEGFAKGLVGGRGQVTTALNAMQSQLSAAMQATGQKVQTLEDRLKTLTSARKKDTQAIKETTDALAQARSEYNGEQAAFTTLTKKLSEERVELTKLSTQYDTLTTKLNNANDALANAKKTRDDYNATVTTQFETLPTITDTTTVADYVDSIQKQIEDTKVFSNTLARLRKLGLNDDAYKQLLSQGATALPFAQELLAGGKTSVDQINSLDKQLDTAAAALGKSASSALYQAAVDSAQGLVDGLKKQQSAIQKQMNTIADAMVKAIKNALGIKSPSTVFKEIGSYSAEGLINGLDAASVAVSKSAESMGQSAITSLSKSLSGMSDLITGPVDITPTITPVLDLSSVKKNAGDISGMLTAQPISVDAAYAKAVGISNSTMTDSSTVDSITGAKVSAAPINFNQYNTSPKTLSAADIYRQTKNQLSIAKGALKNP
jgi:tape measure domain-containing protein